MKPKPKPDYDLPIDVRKFLDVYQTDNHSIQTTATYRKQRFNGLMAKHTVLDIISTLDDIKVIYKESSKAVESFGGEDE